MDSTPPASTMFISPDFMARAALIIASIPEPHSLLMVVPGTDVGKPAKSDDMRATLRLSSPAWFAHPNITSSMAAGSNCGFSLSTDLIGMAARSSGRTLESAPAYRPMGVRR